MGVHNFERGFAERAIDRHGLKLLRPADAAEYVARCAEHGIEVLGIDGFRIDGDSIQPLMEHSIDLTSRPSLGNPHQEAANFLASRLDSNLRFEVVVWKNEAQPSNPMIKPRVYADFHNADAHGRLRLNCVGTTEDLARQAITLHDGMPLTLYADDLDQSGQLDELLVDGIVSFSEEENCWVATIDWSAIHHASDEPAADLGRAKT